MQPEPSSDRQSQLAEAFLQRKKALAMKYGAAQQSSSTDQPQATAAPKQQLSKPSKTKEELAALRKEMMKPKRPEPSEENKSEVATDRQMESQTDSQRGVPSSRLGQKTSVSKKEMLALTNKNYELLPEVQQRKA